MTRISHRAKPVVPLLPLLYKPLGNAIVPFTLVLDAIGDLPPIIRLVVVGVNRTRGRGQGRPVETGQSRVARTGTTTAIARQCQ